MLNLYFCITEFSSPFLNRLLYRFILLLVVCFQISQHQWSVITRPHQCQYQLMYWQLTQLVCCHTSYRKHLLNVLYSQCYAAPSKIKISMISLKWSSHLHVNGNYMCNADTKLKHETIYMCLCHYLVSGNDSNHKLSSMQLRMTSLFYLLPGLYWKILLSAVLPAYVEVTF